MPGPRQTRAYAALTLVAALWGSYPAFAKLGRAHLPPPLLVGLRTALASGFLVFLLLRRDGDHVRALAPGDLRTFAFLDFTGVFVSMGGTYVRIAFTTAASATILQAATPVMVAVGARVYLAERLTRMQWAGVACSGDDRVAPRPKPGRARGLGRRAVPGHPGRGGPRLVVRGGARGRSEPGCDLPEPAAGGGAAARWALLGERLGPPEVLGGAAVLAGVGLVTRPARAAGPGAARTG